MTILNESPAVHLTYRRAPSWWRRLGAWFGLVETCEVHDFAPLEPVSRSLLICPICLHEAQEDPARSKTLPLHQPSSAREGLGILHELLNEEIAYNPTTEHGRGFAAGIKRAQELCMIVDEANRV